jgi:hypothetical protein
MGERADWPCPATGLDHCPDYCEVACLRLDEASWPDVEADPQDMVTVEWPMA